MHAVIVIAGKPAGVTAALRGSKLGASMAPIDGRTDRCPEPGGGARFWETALQATP